MKTGLKQASKLTLSSLTEICSFPHEQANKKNLRKILWSEETIELLGHNNKVYAWLSFSNLRTLHTLSSMWW